MKHHLSLLCSVLILSCLLSTFVFAVESSETAIPIGQYDVNMVYDSLHMWDSEKAACGIAEDEENVTIYRIYHLSIHNAIGFRIFRRDYLAEEPKYVVLKDVGSGASFEESLIGIYMFHHPSYREDDIYDYYDYYYDRIELSENNSLFIRDKAKHISETLLPYAMNPALVFEDPSVIVTGMIVDFYNDAEECGHYGIYYETTVGDYILWFNQSKDSELYFMSVETFHAYLETYYEGLKWAYYQRRLKTDPDLTYEEFLDRPLYGGNGEIDYYLEDFDYASHRFTAPVNPCDYHSSATHTEQKKSCASSLSIAALLPAIGAAALAGMTVRRKQKGKR